MRHYPTDREERAAIVAHIRRVIGSEATRLMIAAGLPGGTRTQRTKNAAFADGVAHAVKVIADAIEAGEHFGGE